MPGTIQKKIRLEAFFATFLFIAYVGSCKERAIEPNPRDGIGVKWDASHWVSYHAFT